MLKRYLLCWSFIVHAVMHKKSECGAHSNCDEPGNSANYETWYQPFHRVYMHSPEQLFCMYSHVQV